MGHEVIALEDYVEPKELLSVGASEQKRVNQIRSRKTNRKTTHKAVKKTIKKFFRLG